MILSCRPPSLQRVSDDEPISAMDLPEDQAPAPFAEWSPEALIEFMTNRICRRLNRADIRANETARNRLWGQHSVLCSLLQTCVENERNAGVRRRALDMMLNISDISPSSSELERRDDAMEEAEDNETESERRDDVSTLSQASDPDGWIERHY